MSESQTSKQRLIEYLKFKGINHRKFEDSIGVSFGYVNAMRKGLGVEKIEQVRRVYPDLNINWLLTGEGDMFNDSPINENHITTTSSNEELLIEYYKQRIVDLESIIEEKNKQIENLNNLLQIAIETAKMFQARHLGKDEE